MYHTADLLVPFSAFSSFHWIACYSPVVQLRVFSVINSSLEASIDRALLNALFMVTKLLKQMVDVASRLKDVHRDFYTDQITLVTLTTYAPN